ncbi:hypothetical protein [Bradyrhizobium sp. 87]|uniref:hypothetical protein n=1 Tax=Bradyrhizobium sp. 87 TaxID=2782682 RepID=UPI001FF9849B|nr:hypothetical protein [Bradyrhizobium sp. 87]
MIELLEQVAATSSPAPERSIVQLDKERVDRLVEGGEREEATVAQTRQNPSPDGLDPDFDLGFGKSCRLQVMRVRSSKRCGSRIPSIRFAVARSS